MSETTASGRGGDMGRPRAGLAAACVALALAALALPASADERRGAPAAPVSWSAALPPGLTAAEADPVALARWWDLLQDPLLADLERRALGGSLDLRAAEARLREAWARRGAAAAERLPSASLSGAASRTWTPDAGASRFSLGIDASWESDLFGRRRNARRAAEATAQASEESLRDVRVSIASEVALAYLEVRVTQKRLATAEANLALLQETSEIAGWRHQAGLTTELDVEQARLSVEQVRAQLPLLRTTLGQARNRIAVLLGQRPGALDGVLAAAGEIPVPPLALAVGLPADLLRRRPDVRRAERELVAQAFQLKSIRASRYPDLTLSGSIGLESLAAGNLLSAAARVLSGAVRLGQTLFDGGRVRQQVAIQTAVEEQAAVAYEAAVLGAREEVEGALVAYAEEQARRDALVAAAELARSTASLARERYGSGLVDFQVVLEAQRSQLSVEDQLTSSSGSVSSDLVRLYKALGGGWTPQSAS